MQSNLSKNLNKIFSAFNNLSKLTKSIIKYGTQAFLLLFFLGTLFFVLNRTVLSYNAYNDLIAISVIKNSFTIFAEAVIGGLIIDYVINK